MNWIGHKFELSLFYLTSTFWFDKCISLNNYFWPKLFDSMCLATTRIVLSRCINKVATGPLVSNILDPTSNSAYWVAEVLSMSMATMIPNAIMIGMLILIIDEACRFLMVVLLPLFIYALYRFLALIKYFLSRVVSEEFMNENNQTTESFSEDAIEEPAAVCQQCIRVGAAETVARTTRRGTIYGYHCPIIFSNVVYRRKKSAVTSRGNSAKSLRPSANTTQLTIKNVDASFSPRTSSTLCRSLRRAEIYKNEYSSPSQLTVSSASTFLQPRRIQTRRNYLKLWQQDNQLESSNEESLKK